MKQCFSQYKLGFEIVTGTHIVASKWSAGSADNRRIEDLSLETRKCSSIAENHNIFLVMSIVHGRGRSYHANERKHSARRQLSCGKNDVFRTCIWKHPSSSQKRASSLLHYSDSKIRSSGFPFCFPSIVVARHLATVSQHLRRLLSENIYANTKPWCVLWRKMGKLYHDVLLCVEGNITLAGWMELVSWCLNAFFSSGASLTRGA
jgi:hypothetical protein